MSPGHRIHKIAISTLMFANSSCVIFHKLTLLPMFCDGILNPDTAIDIQLDLNPDSVRTIGQHSLSDPKYYFFI